MYCNCGIIIIYEYRLDDLHDDCLLPLHGFNIYRQDPSSNTKTYDGGVALVVNVNWCQSNFGYFKLSKDFIDCFTLRSSSKHLNK